MSALDLMTKTCSKCGEERPLSEFYRYAPASDGRTSQCKPCMRATARANKQRRRDEIGDEAFREEHRLRMRKLRESNSDVRQRGRLSNDAYNAALFALRDIHRDQFDRLLAAERYERGLA